MKRGLITLLWIALAGVFAGCELLNQAAQLGGSQLGLSSSQTDSVIKAGAATGKALEKFTPENEYFIGRSLAACILRQYKVYDNKAATEYLNLLGQSLAAFSDLPETFKGYHFLIMNTDEINAFATPGGFILVSRGLLRCCPSEDAVASVLAHEVGHVQLSHGIQSIKKGRYTAALTSLGAAAAKTMGSAEIAELTTQFEGTLDDIMKEMVVKGYSRKAEFQADAASVTILKRAGYDPAALKAMLQQIERKAPSSEKGFGKTHPDPKDRISEIESQLDGATTVSPAPAARQVRFEKALKGV